MRLRRTLLTVLTSVGWPLFLPKGAFAGLRVAHLADRKQAAPRAALRRWTLMVNAKRYSLTILPNYPRASTHAPHAHASGGVR